MNLDEYVAPITEQPLQKNLRDSKDDAFYTAAGMADIKDVKGTYEGVLDELSRFGKSPLTESLQKKYQEEVRSKESQDANSIVMNTALSIQEKKLQLLDVVAPKDTSPKAAFASTISSINATATKEGEKVQNLRRKNIKDLSKPSSEGHRVLETKDPEQNNRRTENQKTFLGNLWNMGADIVGLAKTNWEQGFFKSGSGALQTGRTVGEGLVRMLGAGYAGIWQVGKGNVEKAGKVIRGMQEANFKGDGASYEAGMKVLDSLGRAMDIPFRNIGDFAYEKTLSLTGNSEAAAIVGATFYAVPQAFGYGAGGYSGIKAAVKGATATQSILEGVRAASPLGTSVKGSKKNSPTVRIEPTLNLGKTTPASVMWVKADSPITTMERINKPYAEEVLSRAVKDASMSDALGTTPAGIVMRNMLPQLGDDITRLHPDIAEKLKTLDAQAEHALEVTKVDAYLFDPEAIANDIKRHVAINEEQSTLSHQVSSSYFEDTGRAYRGQSIYTKSEGNGWVDPVEAADMREKMVWKIVEGRAETNLTTMSPVERRALYNKATREVTLHQLDDGTIAVKWDYNRYYDPVVDTLMTPYATFAGFDVTRFANSPVGKWLYSPATRLPQWTTGGFARAEIRGGALKKVWEDTMKNEILTTKPRRQLETLIMTGEDRGKHLTLAEIRELNPYMGKANFKSLVNGYEHYRRLDEHLYFTLNRAHRTQKVTQGFKGLYDADGKYVGILGREIKPEELLDTLTGEMTPGKKVLQDGQGQEAQAVYDFTMKDTVDAATGKTSKSHVGEVSVEDAKVGSRAVYKLDQPMTINGKVFEFGVGVKEGATPKNLLPKIEGHFPHINVEPYFIKAIPKELFVNGRHIKRTDPGGEELYQAHATTVNVAKTQAEGDIAAAKRNSEFPEYEHKAVVDRTDVDKGLVTYLQAVKFGADIAKKRKKERLTFSDGSLGKLEDVAVAMHKRYSEAARLDAFKDIDFEFRKKFLERFGEFTDNRFPETIQDIKTLGAGASVHEQRLVTDARNMFDQYMSMNKIKDTILDEGWRNLMMDTAYKLEGFTTSGPEWTKWLATQAVDAARGLAKRRDPLLSTALKVATVRAIHLNMQKQWAMQTSQLVELSALGLLNGNLKFPIELHNMGPRIFAGLVAHSNILPQGLRDVSLANLHHGSGLTSAEFREVLDAFWDTGIPTAIDKNPMMHGVIRDSTGKLVPTTFDKTSSAVLKTAKAVPTVTKTLGFTTAELITQIGMWLYARSEFKRLNPGQKWNTPHNKEMIAEKSWGVGNSMQTGADSLPYQEGTWRAFLQFQAFTAKSSLQIFNSKFLNRREKTLLAAIRAIAYGERAVLGATLITQPIKNEVYNLIDPNDEKARAEVDQYFEWWERGAGDIAGNYLINQISNGKDDLVNTDLALMDTLSPISKSGIPFYDLINNIIDIWNGDANAKDKIAAAGAVNALMDTANTLIGLFTYNQDKVEGMDDIQISKLIRQTAKFAPMWNNFEKGLMMSYTEQLASKNGNSLGMQATQAEAWAAVLGVQSYKLQVYYESQKDTFEMQKHIADSAKSNMKLLNEINFVSPTETDKDKIDAYTDQLLRINILGAAFEKEGWGEQYRRAMQAEMKKEENKGIQGPLARLFRSRADGFSSKEAQNADMLLRLKDSIGEEGVKRLQLLTMELPKVEYDFGDKE